MALPWLGALLLLALGPNRTGRAWWIWVPLGLVVALANLCRPWFSSIGEEELDVFVQVVTAGAFGLAAVWLLAPYLARRYRILTFLCLLVALAGFGGLTLLVTQDWGEVNLPILCAALILLALGTMALALALTLAGVICRKQFRPAGLGLWLFIGLLGFSLVLTSPFLVFAALSNGGNAMWMEFLLGVAAFAVVVFVVALPFLLLSTTNLFYRERLKAVLHIERTTAKVIAPPPMAPIETTT